MHEFTEEIIAESSGVSLRTHPRGVVLVDHGTVHLHTFVFVLGLVTLLLGVNGIAQLILWLAPGLILFGFIALAVAGLGALGLRALVRRIRGARSSPTHALTPIFVFDLDQQMLMGPKMEPIAPLSSVEIKHGFQITSSAKSLVVRWPRGEEVICRGNAFAGGISDLEHALLQALGRR